MLTQGDVRSNVESGREAAELAYSQHACGDSACAVSLAEQALRLDPECALAAILATYIVRREPGAATFGLVVRAQNQLLRRSMQCLNALYRLRKVPDHLMMAAVGRRLHATARQFATLSAWPPPSGAASDAYRDALSLIQRVVLHRADFQSSEHDPFEVLCALPHIDEVLGSCTARGPDAENVDGAAEVKLRFWRLLAEAWHPDVVGIEAYAEALQKTIAKRHRQRSREVREPGQARYIDNYDYDGDDDDDDTDND